MRDIFRTSINIRFSYIFLNSLFHVPRRRYANGAQRKIEENAPEIIPIPIVKAKDCMTDSPNIYMASTAKSVESHVHRDLLIVCHRLVSKTFPYNMLPFSNPSLYFTVFSLILSKMIMVSLILYHIVVKIAITKTVSTVIVLSIIIRIQYPPAGIAISKSIVAIVTNAKVSGDICFLIEANENII